MAAWSARSKCVRCVAGNSISVHVRQSEANISTPGYDPHKTRWRLRTRASGRPPECTKKVRRGPESSDASGTDGPEGPGLIDTGTTGTSLSAILLQASVLYSGSLWVPSLRHTHWHADGVPLPSAAPSRRLLGLRVPVKPRLHCPRCWSCTCSHLC